MIALAVVKRRALQSVQTLTLVIAAVFLFLMAAGSARQIPPFFVCAVPTIAVLLNVRLHHEERVTRRASVLVNAVSGAACAVAAAFFVAYAWSTHLPRLRWDPVPSSVLSAIEECSGPLYNRYNDGGALLWFAKHRKIFIDSRQDPFPMELVLEHIQVEKSGNYRQLFERYHIECALTNQGRPLAARLRRDGWLERRAAGTWTVYSRPSKQVAMSPL